MWIINNTLKLEFDPYSFLYIIASPLSIMCRSSTKAILGSKSHGKLNLKGKKIIIIFIYQLKIYCFLLLLHRGWWRPPLVSLASVNSFFSADCYIKKLYSTSVLQFIYNKFSVYLSWQEELDINSRSKYKYSLLIGLK